MARYTNKQKIEALKLCELDGLNKTHQKLGIPRKTLSAWKREYDLITKENTEEKEMLEKGNLLVASKEDLLEKHMVEYIPQAIDFKNEALRKLQELIGKARTPDHIHAVAGAMKIIHESMFPKGASINVDARTQHVQNNIFQVVDDLYKDKLK